ncbi:hypothetical protein RPC_3821 [Rhodopseudomonas palustris BisB18]|uniref:Uncharacterized protein n=1 Tax=Rhodopseudomonas palustris (strain BisB18) TaxID=316056 RepID=Q20ZT1_RHOPB
MVAGVKALLTTLARSGRAGVKAAPEASGRRPAPGRSGALAGPVRVGGRAQQAVSVCSERASNAPRTPIGSAPQRRPVSAAAKIPEFDEDHPSLQF